VIALLVEFNIYGLRTRLKSGNAWLESVKLANPIPLLSKAGCTFITLICSFYAGINCNHLDKTEGFNITAM